MKSLFSKLLLISFCVAVAFGQNAVSAGFEKKKYSCILRMDRKIQHGQPWAFW